MNTAMHNVTGEAVFPHLTIPNTKFNPTGDFELYVRVTTEERDALNTRMHEDVQAQVLTVMIEKGLPAETPISQVPWKEARDNNKVVIPNYWDIKVKQKALIGIGIKQRTWEPNIFDEYLQPWDKARTIGMGSTVKVAFRPFVYWMQGKLGLSLRLQGVQVLKLVNVARTPEAFGFVAALSEFSGIIAGTAKEPSAAGSVGVDVAALEPVKPVGDDIAQLLQNFRKAG